MSDALERLAWLAGIEPGYHDLVGNWHHTSTEAKLALLAAMRIDIEAAEAEIARLEALPGDEAGTQRCLTPGELGIGRGWGVTCQVYGLRSPAMPVSGTSRTWRCWPSVWPPKAPISWG